MNCPKCKMLMHNFDDLNFLCPGCHFHKYRDSPSRESYLMERGSKRCPVCGKISVQNNGGYVCLGCSTKYEFKKNKSEIHLHPGIVHKELPLYVRMAMVGFVIWILIGSAMEITQAEPVDAVDVEFTYDDRFDAVKEPINIDNASGDETVIGEWETDLGNIMPNGTFYGSLFSPSLFQHHFKPQWKEYNGTEIYGRYSYIMLASNMNFSSEILMSGSSQFWIRIPVHPDSVDENYGIYILIFEGATNSSMLEFESDYDAMNYIMHPSYNDKMPNQMIYFRIADDFQYGLGKITENHIYLNVNGILKPNIEYVLACHFKMKENSRLKTYWTDNENPYGQHSTVYFADTLQDEDADPDITILESSSINVSLDLDWSFIFVEGIGQAGLFGKKINFHQGETLTLYPFFNTSRTSTDYMSFVLPFISDESINASVYVGQGSGASPGLGIHIWYFDDSEYEFHPDYCYTYNDFIIFSTNSTIDYDEFNDDDRWNVMVSFTFNTDCNLTLLCHENSREIISWDDIADETELECNSSKNPFKHPTIWDGDDSWVMLYYDVWISGRATELQWAYVSMNSTGHSIFTYHFPQEIHLSSQFYELKKDDETESNVTLTPSEMYWKLAKEAWGKGEILEGIKYAMTSALYLIWDGGKSFIGGIGSFLSDAWDKMKEWGGWIVARVKEFIGKIWDFLQDVFDTVMHFWDSFKYLVAPIIFMSIVVIGSKASKTVMKPKDE